MSGMKEKELRKFSTCCACSRKIGELALPIMWKVNGERHAVNAGAVQRQQGLTQLLGGNALVAQHMGPNEDMTGVLDRKTIMVCDECMQERLPEIFSGE